MNTILEKLISLYEFNQQFSIFSKEGHDSFEEVLNFCEKHRLYFVTHHLKLSDSLEIFARPGSPLYSISEDSEISKFCQFGDEELVTIYEKSY